MGELMEMGMAREDGLPNEMFVMYNKTHFGPVFHISNYSCENAKFFHTK